MTTIKTEYHLKNEPSTGMSDNEWYGREEALGIDLDACRRAASREARRGFRLIIRGNGIRGRLEIRRAVYRLSLAVGNQSRAEEYLADTCSLGLETPIGKLGNMISEKDKADREQLDLAAARQHPHPQLLENLQVIEQELAAATA